MRLKIVAQIFHGIFKKTLSLCLLLALFYNTVPVLASPVAGTDFMNNIVIRQQTKTTSGISVCGPVEIDLRILDIACLANMKSLDDYALWLQKAVQYKRDKFYDVWSSPEETLAKRSGDCEDIAFFNKAFLSVLGYKPKVIALLRKGGHKGHAICVFKEQGRYMWFDNTTLKRTPASSIEEFTSYILKNSIYASLLEVDLKANEQTV